MPPKKFEFGGTDFSLWGSTSLYDHLISNGNPQAEAFAAWNLHYVPYQLPE
jgi:hypothetical protein